MTIFSKLNKFMLFKVIRPNWILTPISWETTMPLLQRSVCKPMFSWFLLLMFEENYVQETESTQLVDLLFNSKHWVTYCEVLTVMHGNNAICTWQTWASLLFLQGIDDLLSSWNLNSSLYLGPILICAFKPLLAISPSFKYSITNIILNPNTTFR